MSYIYLASPYTHPDLDVRRHRYYEALDYAIGCTQKGEVIFSPIVHSYPMEESIPGDWRTWEKIDKVFLDVCEKVRVLQIEGWDKSVGVSAEIEYAKSIGKEVEYATV